MNDNNEILVWKLTPGPSGMDLHPYHPGHPVVSSLDEESKFLPAGAYTTLRTYSHTKVMRIADHFMRLEDSARRANATFDFQFETLRPALRAILNLSSYEESRIRVTLDLEKEPGNFYVTLERLHTPPEQDYQMGVKALTGRLRRDNPKAKLTNFLAIASKYRSELPPGVNEMLMVGPDDYILEGLSSNFYGVMGDTIWTQDEGILPGITRSAVLEIAECNAIPVKHQGIRMSQLASLDECFITSASRGVLPVVQIDDTVIGDGCPGRLSQKIIHLFNLWVEKSIEEI